MHKIVIVSWKYTLNIKHCSLLLITDSIAIVVHTGLVIRTCLVG